MSGSYIFNKILDSDWFWNFARDVFWPISFQTIKRDSFPSGGANYTRMSITDRCPTEMDNFLNGGLVLGKSARSESSCPWIWMTLWSLHISSSGDEIVSFYVTEFKNVYFIWIEPWCYITFVPSILVSTLNSRFLGALRSIFPSRGTFCCRIWNRGAIGDVSRQSKTSYRLSLFCARRLATHVPWLRDVWSMQPICFGPFVHF